MKFTPKQINEDLEKEYQYNLQMYFNEDFSLHKTMKNNFDILLKNIQEDKTPMSIGFEELADFYLVTAIYANNFCENKNKIEEFFTASSLYSERLLTVFNKQCANCHMSIVLMRKAVYLWASIFLVKNYDDAINVGNELIDSINAKGSIIRYGNRFHNESWFLIDLFSKAFENPYDEKRADYAEDISEYQEIIDNWDTNDLVKVDNYVSSLIELHLLIEEEEDNETSEFMLFHKSSMKIYFYEVIVFLSIRKIKGLVNPDEYSHKLMQTAIMKRFLNNEAYKEGNTPYKEELLLILNEKCFDKKSKKESEQSKPKTTIQKDTIALITGEYKAVLPHNHPQAKELIKEPFAYCYYEKDKKFNYDGLEDYDIDNIRWVRK